MAPRRALSFVGGKLSVGQGVESERQPARFGNECCSRCSGSRIYKKRNQVKREGGNSGSQNQLKNYSDWRILKGPAKIIV
ncbi:hypothetical protein CEXT_189991 [Caerostris extrusa]|uniref:Uncharacterized protein n=1 Tax=Caerostris extrusa TaxID=172846 RepID=A0AAV4NDA3_CAEEX|nr:hypothetical protein CEXT_189991 [Caerostris extrusa]